MRITPLRRFSDDDYPDAEPWFLNFLDNLNPVIDTLNPLFVNNVDIDNNLLAERQTVTLSHGVPVIIKLQKLPLVPRLVRVGYAAGFVGVGAITGYLNNGTFLVTVYFMGTPPTVPVLTMLIFEP